MAIYQIFGRYLSNDGEEYPIVFAALKKALAESPDSLIDYIDGITVWDKVEFGFTVKEFCDLADITLDDELTDDDDSATNFAVDVPPHTIDKFGENPWVNIETFKTRQEALDFVQEYFGADENGMVSLITAY